jgi:hypothetical protein
LYLLVFFFKGRSESRMADQPACAHCDCHRSQGQPNDFSDTRIKCKKHSTLTDNPLAEQDVCRSLRFRP